ncbi:hypothetical protein [Brevundimonas sp. G8]|uniref:hypothetical protein n=1 Tax=Brevundimonas sp. G8 TaxID=1350776 RepID=UPI00135BBDCA|nr:hypothetical protein [Brevundimonas sp. G8]
MDLSKLAFVVVDTPGLPTVTVDVGSGDFETWARRGLRQVRWPDGSAFVRALLTERARIMAPDQAWEEAPTAFDPATASAVSAEGIDAFATALIAAAAGFLVPRLESQGGKVVVRDAEKAKSSVAILPDETPVAALMRIVATKTADRELARQKAAARYDLQLGATQQAAIGISRVLSEQNKLSELMRQASQVLALKETLGRSGVSSTLLAAMGEDTTLSRVIRANNQYRDVASGWATGLSILNRDRDLLQGAIRTALEGQSVLRTAGLADALRLSAVERTATGGVLDTWRRAETASALALTISGTPSWARSLNRQLNLRLPRAALASLAIFSAADPADATTLAETVAALGVQGRPGWLYTADAVLVGGAPPSAGSAVLRDYDTADANTPVGETIGDIQTFDSGGLEGLQDRVNRIPDRLSMLDRTDLVGRHGLVNLLAVLLAVAALATTVALELDDRDAKALIAMETKNNAVLSRIAQTQAEIVQTARDDRNVRGLRRSSWLRVGPDQSATPIRKLFPDELVRVRKAQDNWVEVEVFDYGGDSTVGWMPRSALAAPRA